MLMLVSPSFDFIKYRSKSIGTSVPSAGSLYRKPATQPYAIDFSISSIKQHGQMIIMNTFNKLLMIPLLLVPICAQAEFSIEEEDLTALPHAVDVAIRQSKGFDASECKLIGKAIVLSDHSATHFYAATTANGCHWGNALGPIWVVRDESVPTTLLATEGNNLSVSKASQQGLHDVNISSGTAGYDQFEIWKYDGQHYQKKNSYIFTADDPATCKAHPDICPFDFDH